MLSALKALGVGAVSFALIVIVAIGGYNVLALNLGTVSGDYFKGALAVFVLLGGAWLSAQGLGMFGKPFMLAATLGLLVITVRHRNPGVANLVAASNESVSVKADRTAEKLRAVHEVPCTPPLVGSNGQPLYWWSPEDAHIRCFDRAGKHPEGKGELLAVTDAVAQLIMVQQHLPVPSPSAATPKTGKTELPELGERPIVKPASELTELGQRSIR